MQSYVAFYAHDKLQKVGFTGTPEVIPNINITTYSSIFRNKKHIRITLDFIILVIIFLKNYIHLREIIRKKGEEIGEGKERKGKKAKEKKRKEKKRTMKNVQKCQKYKKNSIYKSASEQ